MKVWGITEAQLEATAKELEIQIYMLRSEGKALRFTLRPTEKKAYRRLGLARLMGYSGQGIPIHCWAVCWHGHRDFMRALFRINPQARVKTGWADYRDTRDFEAKYEDTGYRNIGSIMNPVEAQSACECGA